MVFKLRLVHSLRRLHALDIMVHRLLTMCAVEPCLHPFPFIEKLSALYLITLCLLLICRVLKGLLIWVVILRIKGSLPNKALVVHMRRRALSNGSLGSGKNGLLVGTMRVRRSLGLDGHTTHPSPPLSRAYLLLSMLLRTLLMRSLQGWMFFYLLRLRKQG